MTGFGFLALAMLIVLLLPIVVLPWEGRRVPDLVYALLAAGGILASGIGGGIGSALWAAAACLICLAVVAAGVTLLRLTLQFQLLTGGHIKLLAAGAAWLGIGGTFAMLLLTFAALFTVGAIGQFRPLTRRPDFSVIAALAILSLNLQQSLFTV